MLFFYRIAWLIGYLLIQLILCLPLPEKKWTKALKARAWTNGRWPWQDHSFKSSPLWIHCSSGEFEYAKPLIKELKDRHPSIEILVTYSSPSVKKSLSLFKLIDFFTPLPFDLPWVMRKFLCTHKPLALLIARTDIWPEALHQCQKLNIPTYLFSATLDLGNKRMNRFFRFFSKWSMSKLKFISCVSEEDLFNFHKIGVKSTFRVQGDTRFDQVFERLTQPLYEQEMIKIKLASSAKPILTLGSTWAEDEAQIFPHLSILSEQFQIILAPHELHPKALETKMIFLKEQGLRVKLLSEVMNVQSHNIRAGFDVLIIDKVGLLAEIYRMSTLSFVGGSFKKQVHSVLEPLAAGNLVAVGPHYKNNREALTFSALDVGSVSPNDIPLVKVVQDGHGFLLWALAHSHFSHRDLIIDRMYRYVGASKKLTDDIEAEILNLV